MRAAGERCRRWIGKAWAVLLASACQASSAGAADHWAYRPVRRPVVPHATAWGVNPIDAFIARRHRTAGLAPAPEAPRRSLIRRLTLDLTGLPPTPAEVAAFLADHRPDAWERLVERLLASPAYGERWGRHWLDLARWAESEGYESNHPRPHAWHYRDYVVRAFNEDRPYDRFVRQQLAGDEMLPCADENLIATGFLAAARLSSNEEDKARQRNDVLVDVVNATGSTFLGLTLHCAQCHNHKFDALSTADYYRFLGFFLQGQPGNLVLRDPAGTARWEQARAPEYTAAVALRDALFAAARARLLGAARRALTPAMRQALDVPPDRRTPEQERLARTADLTFQLTPKQVEAAIGPEDRPLYTELKKKIEVLERGMPDRPQTWGFYSPVTSPTRVDVLPMRGFYPLPFEPDFLARLRPRVLIGGDVHRLGRVVRAGWPEVFGPTPAEAVRRRPRLALADWLTNPANPLTARVWVNRLWHYHFGRGLVATPSDFGVRGAPPTHPELLDWLASELVQSGWSTKHVHRLIVGSQTYRLSSRPDARNAAIDPDNKLCWRWTPRRLEAEAVRDALLAVSGELDRQAGGPGVVDDDKALRRTLYLVQKRERPPAVQALFDGPSAAAESCPQRAVSTVPLQSLYLLNNDFAVQRARALARRVQAAAGPGQGRRIELVFALVLGRPPDDAERAAAAAFFRSPEVGPEPWAAFCQALLNTNEFVYLE